MDKQLKSIKKLFDATKLLIEAWRELGLDVINPFDYKKLVDNNKKIGERYGWK